MKCTIFMYEASSLSLVYYFDRQHLEGGLLHLQHIYLNDSKNCQITRGTSSPFMVTIASRTARFSSCTVCGWLLYTHSFKCPDKKKFGTAWSGDRTGHGIPDTWKLLSSLINTLHITGISCHWRGFDMARYHLFLGVQALPPTNHRRAKVRSEKCRSALRHSV
jgi:hypothetical protein